jgi:hypothetical protein
MVTWLAGAVAVTSGEHTSLAVFVRTENPAVGPFPPESSCWTYADTGANGTCWGQR